MSDNTDSAATPEQVPAQAPHSAGTGQPNSGSLTASDFVRFLDDPDVKAALARLNQSDKDRGVNRALTTATEVRDEVTRIAQYLGIDDPKKIEAARNQRVLDENMAWIEQQRQGRVPDQPLPGSNVDLAKARQDILNVAGLTEAPQGFDDYLASLDWKNPVAAALSASTWVAEKKSQQRQPTPADTAPPSSGVPHASLSQFSNDELGDKLTELQRNPTKNAKERAEIMAELERRRNPS